MSWGLVFAGVSAASGLFNAIDESNANRRILGDLTKIKKYLKELRKTLNTVKNQNTEILKKLDDLPIRIRQIVEEIVQTAFLEEKYSDIDDLRENYLTLRRWRRVGIRSLKWQRYSKSMNYIFDHENRISKLFEMINICEFALCLTRNRAKSIVILRLDEKIDNLTLLIDDFKTKIESNISKLKIDLDNTKFIKSHNLTDDLTDFNDLILEKQPDQTVSQRYSERVCRIEYRRTGGHQGGENDPEPVNVCRNVARTRQVPDTSFHNARNNHLTSIENQIHSLKKELTEFGEILKVVNTLKSYRNKISPLSYDKISENEKPMYFFDDINEDKNNEKIFLDEKGFNEYFELEDNDFSTVKVIDTEENSFDMI